MHEVDINEQYGEAYQFMETELSMVETMRLLIEQGSDVAAKDESLSTPLHLASFSGFLNIVQLLIEHGADVTSRDDGRRTPLHLASCLVSVNAASLLCRHRSGANGQDDCSHEPYLKADMVRLLIDHGADVAAQDEAHSTPLHFAAFWGSAETVKLLIWHGADVTAKDKSNQTPLHLASSKVSSRTASLLIQCSLIQLTVKSRHHGTFST